MGNHKNKTFMKKPAMNPALKQKIFEQNLAASLAAERQKGFSFASRVFEIMTLDVLYNKHGFDDADDLRFFLQNLEYEADLIDGEYCSIPDILKMLRDERGFTLTDEQLTLIDPGLAGLLSAPEGE